MSNFAALIRTELAARGCQEFGVEIRKTAPTRGSVEPRWSVRVTDRRNGAWVKVGAADYDRAMSAAPPKLSTEIFMKSLACFGSAVSGDNEIKNER
jgi:hypothetical protein